jgi:hypothetical protein
MRMIATILGGFNSALCFMTASKNDLALQVKLCWPHLLLVCLQWYLTSPRRLPLEVRLSSQPTGGKAHSLEASSGGKNYRTSKSVSSIVVHQWLFIASKMSNPIGEAFESAKREFRNELDDEKLYHDILQTTSIDQVYEATNKLQAEQLKTGGLRHLAKIGPYLTRIADYSKAVETFVQVKPDILALVWGPIVLLLQWASALKTSFDAIVNTTEDIGLALPEFDQMAKLFPDNKQIQDVLLLFFKDILEFYRLAFRFFRLSSKLSQLHSIVVFVSQAIAVTDHERAALKISFEALWPKRRDKFKHLASIIERHKLMMRDRVWLEDISQAHEARRLALEDHDARESEARRKEYNTIMTRIAPQRYHTKLDAVRRQVCEGSGDWLLKDDTFTTWMDPGKKSSRLLWLQGIPGAGM